MPSSKFKKTIKSNGNIGNYYTYSMSIQHSQQVLGLEYSNTFRPHIVIKSWYKRQRSAGRSIILRFTNKAIYHRLLPNISYILFPQWVLLQTIDVVFGHAQR